MFTSIIRTIILYAIIIVALRLTGKRQIGELEPSELVVAILISELAAIPMQDIGTPLLTGVLPIATLVCLEIILSAIQLKSLRFRRILCGKASIVIKDGLLNQREMRRIRITTDELIEELRLKGVTDLSLVKYAIIETNGKLSILLHSGENPATANELGIAHAEPGLPVIIVNDGRVLSHNLKICGLDANWLNKKLSSAGLDSPQDAFLLIVDELNRVYLCPKEKQ